MPKSHRGHGLSHIQFSDVLKYFFWVNINFVKRKVSRFFEEREHTGGVKYRALIFEIIVEKVTVSPVISNEYICMEYGGNYCRNAFIKKLFQSSPIFFLTSFRIGHLGTKFLQVFAFSVCTRLVYSFLVHRLRFFR